MDIYKIKEIIHNLSKKIKLKKKVNNYNSKLEEQYSRVGKDLINFYKYLHYIFDYLEEFNYKLEWSITKNGISIFNKNKFFGIDILENNQSIYVLYQGKEKIINDNFKPIQSDKSFCISKEKKPVEFFNEVKDLILQSCNQINYMITNGYYKTGKTLWESEKHMSKSKLLKEFEDRNLYYSKELLFNYYISLISKPFLILTGISGSGKTKLAESYAEIVSNNDSSKYEFIPVKPEWKDSKGMFGYQNILDNTYSITPLIKLILRALNNPNDPHFLILDEMNLAKTEHYFSDYISLIESRKVKNGLDINDYEMLKNNVEYSGEFTLSQAIILAGLFLSQDNDEYLTVETYRKHNLCQLWKEQRCDEPENFNITFRTELNQGENRLAHNVFESPGGKGYKYRLRNIDQIVDTLEGTNREKFEIVLELYNQLKDEEFYIYQNTLVLHNFNKCLSPIQGCNCSNEECIYKTKEKYKCEKLYNQDNNKYLVPPRIPIPLNLFTVGTVNVDETTYTFSPKVLDRSNVIEFNDIDFNNYLNISAEEFNETKVTTSTNIFDDEYYFSAVKELYYDMNIKIPTKKHALNLKENFEDGFKDIYKIFEVLKKGNLHFGYRVLNEVSLYVENAVKNSDYKDSYKVALDLQILQKILTKLHGSYEKLWFPLFEILKICCNKQLPFTETEVTNLKYFTSDYQTIFKYPRTAKKVIHMLEKLDRTGFASFIE